jgi:hypothetical protein
MYFVVYIAMLSVFRGGIYSITSNAAMIGGLEEFVSGRGQLEMLSRHLSGGTEESDEKSQPR